ncbi:MAG: SsrA-binding protein SmpB [Proteobacteria bacterium]|nr:SsrA-binding protein SmpB [Pseudomonadota bacterium]
MQKSSSNNYKVVAVNRRARFDYHILETLEVGIVLTGSEVKSLREGKASITEAFAGEMVTDNSACLYLFNANIPEYKQANRFNHEPKRPRKLLLRGRQLKKILGSIRKKGTTLVPLQLYFNHKGIAKLEIALAQGKKTVDKRETIKKRDWEREQATLLRRRS